MKNFTVNFRLQQVTSLTKPVQVRLSLATKDKDGKYIFIHKATGIVLKENEWNAKGLLPKDDKIAQKLISLKMLIEEKMVPYKSFSDKDIWYYHFERNEFKSIVEDSIVEIIEGKPSDSNIYDALSRATQYGTTASHGLAYLKDKLRELNFRIVDSSGNEIDADKFCSFVDYSNIPGGLLKQSAISVANNNEQTQTFVTNISSTQNPNHQTFNVGTFDPTPVPFWKYAGMVADKKHLRNELNEDGVKDYKQKLGAQFMEFNPDITLRQMSDDVSIAFFNFIIDQEYSANYFGNFKKWTKAVLRFAKFEDKIHVPNVEVHSSIYSISKKSLSKEKVKFPYLTEQMLKWLLEIDFDANQKHLEYARDLCLVGSYTGGLTFGDLSQAFSTEKRKVKGQDVNFIRMTRNKNFKDAEIPLTDEVYEILKKYNFQFKSITNQYYNDNIKEVCLMAGQNHSEFIADFHRQRINIKTRQLEPQVHKFYELVSSHTSRRSFCTNMHIHRGIPAKIVMQFSQHDKLESFMTYIHATEMGNFDAFAEQLVLADRNS